MRLQQLQDEVHANAVAKGFWEKPREFGTMLALIHSELSEALEADRAGDAALVAEELADTVIRILDTCGGLEIDLESEILRKMTINKGRPRKHGKRY